MTGYGPEFMAAWDRTARFGLALPPRLLVRKDCIDLAKALPVIVDYFNQHSGEQLVGQTLAIHERLQPELCVALGGVPLHLTIGWIEFNGTPRMQHGEELIQRFLTEKLAAWHREGVPFHLWLTSPALEVLDVTFALNLGWAKSAEECARRVIYQPLHAPRGNPVYHPMLVGDDFLVQSGAIVDLKRALPIES